MPASGHQVRKPTEYLTQVRIDELSQFSIFLLAKEGFTLKVIEWIVGKPRHKKSARIMMEPFDSMLSKVL